MTTAPVARNLLRHQRMSGSSAPLSWGRPGQSSFAQSLLVLAKIAIAIAIVAYLSRTQRLGLVRLESILRHPLQMIALLALMLALVIVLALRWRLLLRSQDYHPPFRDVLSLTFMAVFFDSLLPGGTSDLVRGYYFDRTYQPQDRIRAASTVLVDRFLGLMALLLMALGALSFQGRREYEGLPTLRLVISLTGVLFLLGFVFLCSRGSSGRSVVARLAGRTRIGNVCLDVFDAFKSYQHRRWALYRALVLAVVGHGLVIASFVLLGKFLGETNLRISDYLFLVPVGLCVAQIPISPGGIGVGHVGFYSLFAVVGSRLGADMFSVYVVVHFLSGLPGLAYFVALRRRPTAAVVTPAAS